MKHIFLFLLALAPALALAQTGTVKDSVRVLTTAEISALAPQDTGNVYFIHQGSWRKTRFDTIYQYARLKQLGDRGGIDVTGADGLTWTVDTNAVGAISIAAGAVDSTKLAAGAVVLPGAKVTGTLPVNKGGTGSDTQNFVDLTTAQTVAGVKTFSDRMSISTNINSTSTRHFEVTEGTNAGYFSIQDGSSTANTFAPSFLAFASDQTVGGYGVYFIGGFDAGDDALGTAGSAMEFQARRNNNGSRQNITTGNLFTFSGGSGGAIRLKIDVNGNTILNGGTTQPAEALHVVGNVRITGLANASNPVAVEVDDDGKLIRASSYELKENIHDSPYGLQEVMALRPLVYTYKKKSYGDKRDVGFIAQDIENMIPEAVGTGPDSEIFLDRTKLIPVLVKAIQEQQAQIEELKNRISQLENK